MATTSKRLAGGGSLAGSSPALLNATLLVMALAFGLWLLVSRGQMTWPPSRLLSNLYTIAGCLALVGPFVLARKTSETGLGDLVWMTGGMLVWLADLASLFGHVRLSTWATPLSYQTMGLATLALFVAGGRLHGAGHTWSWTNVVGWVLGLFWVGMGLASLWPGAALALRG
jgi:hypothetical protein